MSQCNHELIKLLTEFGPGLRGYRCCICGWAWGVLAKPAVAIAAEPWSGPPRPASFGPKFYRLCPKDAHTCVDRECLADNDGLHCPKDKPAEANAPQVAPSIEGFTLGGDTCD